MKQIKRSFNLKVIIISVLIIFSSCKHYKEAPPFPYNENEYAQPKTKSFTFSEPDTLQWVTTKLKTLPIKKFSWDKLPSKPIDIGLPYKLKAPLQLKPFDWNSLPSTPFSLDSLPKEKLNIKVSVLGDPKIVKAGSAVIPPQATRGVMQIDDNFGLPGTNYCSIKDKNGMLWFGTRNGIARYDSENIEIYSVDQDLNSGGIFSMLFDSKGRLWFAGDSRTISVIDFKANLVYEISSTNDFGFAYGMMEDNEGRIWYSNRNVGYNIIDIEEKWSKQINPTNGLLGSIAVTPFQDSEGLIWLSTAQGTNIIDLKAGKNIKFTQDQGLMYNFTTSFYEDNEGKIWISGGGGINILNKEKTEISYFTPNEGLEGIGAAADIFQDKTNKFWIGSVNGLLFSYDELTKTIERYVFNDSNSQFVFNLLEDNQGQIWASIAQGGLYKIDPSTGKPGNFTKANGLTDNRVWSTFEAKDGKIWIGTNNGVDIYDPIKKTIKHLGTKQGLVHNGSNVLMEDTKGRIWVGGNNIGSISIVDPVKETIQIITQKEGLNIRRIRTFFEDSHGFIWAGGQLGEIEKIDIEKSTIRKLERDSTITQDAIIGFSEDDNNDIWIGSNGTGIKKINTRNNTRVKITSANGLVSDLVYYIITDNRNRTWAVTQRGVQQIDDINQKITTFTTAEGLAANDVYDIAQQNGEFFLGTSKGFSILKNINKDGKNPFWRVKSIGKKQGINEPDISQNSTTFDKNGRLWAGGAGLQLIVMDEVKVDTAAFPTEITGINIMDKPRVFKDAKTIQEERALLDSLWLPEKQAKDSGYFALNDIHWTKLKEPFNIPEGLTLPQSQNYVSFNFNGGQFTNPDKVVYRYILEGIDKNWSPISDKSESESYRDLAPGNYNFKVASKGFNGVWSTPSEFQFVITPPWWQTWWAYTIFVVLFLGLGLVILHFRSQYLKNENKILEEKVNERTAELKKTIDELENTQSQLIHSEKMASLGELTAGIAHEIQNPMNFITNFSEVSIELMDEMNEEMDKGEYKEAKEISKDIAQNLDKITHHGKRASSIVKGMLEHSRNTSGQKELTDINVLADEYLRLSYHGLRAKNKSFNADFKTDLDESLPKVNVVPQDLGRVVLNLINNAFYAVTSIPEKERDANYKPQVTVSTKKLKDQVLISIKDNGPGIPDDIKEKIFQPFFTTKPTGKGTGLGLSLAYDIITQGHGGAIELNTEPGKGTEFSIYLPL